MMRAPPEDPMAGDTAAQETSLPSATALRAGAAVLLVAIFALAIGASGWLVAEPVKDEDHFLESARRFRGSFPPSLEQLRDYPEVINPLAFVLWGQLDRLTGNGLVAGRALNALLAAVVVAAIAFRRGRTDRTRLFAALGLLAFPYFLGLGVRLYTDVMAACIAFFGARLHLRGRPWPALALFVAAIATRQYMVAVPASLAAWELDRTLRGDARHWREAILTAIAAATLLGWIAFFGGLGPKPGIERWTPSYPAPMFEARLFIVEYALYYLACLGGYFVVPEFALFVRRVDWRAFARRRNVWIALLLAALFAVFPPFFPNFPGGGFDRLVRLALPPGPGDVPRVALYWALACLACMRFAQRLDFAFFLVFVHAAMLTKTQLAWDKYMMPVLVLLWYLKADGRLALRRFPPHPLDPPQPEGDPAVDGRERVR